MSRVADGLQRARERKELEPGLVPDQPAPIRATSSVVVPWHIEAESALADERAPVDGLDSCPNEVGRSYDFRHPIGHPIAEADLAVPLLQSQVSEGTLAQIISPGFERSWEEAVAIVQAIASKVRRGVAVPGPAHILLDAEGSVAFMSRNDSTEHPVVSLAVLLEWLLEGTSAPQDLRQIALQNARALPTSGSVRAFSRALEGFTVSNRKEILLRMASRLHGPAPARRPGIIERVRRWVASALGH